MNGPEGNTVYYELAERALDASINDKIKEYISQVLFDVILFCLYGFIIALSPPPAPPLKSTIHICLSWHLKLCSISLFMLMFLKKTMAFSWQIVQKDSNPLEAD